MWIAKLKAMHKDCHITHRANKFNITDFAYPLVAVPRTEHGKKISCAIHLMVGDANNKKAFLEDLKKDKGLKRFEVNGDIYTYEYEIPPGGEHVHLYYTPNLFFVKPVTMYGGYEYWEVASWDKEPLSGFIEKLRKHMDELYVLKIEKTKLADIYFPNVMPSLTEPQKKALSLAYQHGYYSYPKGVTLKQLAKKAGVSLSTFQENLRKAENKLMPVLIKQQLPL